MFFLNVKRHLLIMTVLLLMATLLSTQALAVDLNCNTDNDADVDITITDTNNRVTKNGDTGATVTVKAAAGFGSNTASESNTITITNTSGSKATISFNYTVSNHNGTFSFSGGGENTGSKYTITLEAGESFTATLTAKTENGWWDTKTATLTMSDIKLSPVGNSANITVNYDSSKGTVKSGTTVVDSGSIVSVTSDGVTLSVHPNGDAAFLGWVDSSNNKVLSRQTTPYTLLPAEGLTSITAIFAIDSPWFLVDNNTYLIEGLSAAITRAESASSKVIALANNATLAAGNYEIPSEYTLLIPFDSGSTLVTTTPPMISAAKPQEYRRLTFASGANLTVNGSLSVASQICAASGGDNARSSTSGYYGRIDLASGSSIVVNGALYVYGYITGDGTITANAAAQVHETFEVREFRGGTVTSGMVMKSIGADNVDTYHVFPFSQYYIQNIEASLTMHSGATLTGHAALSMRVVVEPEMLFVGNGSGIFNLTSGTLTKKYLPDQDRCKFIIDGAVSVSTTSLTLGEGLLAQTITTSDYALPINSNIDIEIKEGGAASILENVEFLPGVRLTVDEGAELIIASGKNLYIYDSAEWIGKNFVFSNRNFTASYYSPTRTYTRTDADITDVRLDVNGTVIVNGGLYTTSSGADIISSEGTGRVEFKTAPASATLYQYVQGADSPYVEVANTSAKLHNGGENLIYENDDAKRHTVTAGTAAGEFYTYCNVCDMWVKGDSGLAHIIQNGEVVGHADDLTEAKSDYATPAAGKYIQMLADSNGEKVAFVDGTVLDLNGNAITGSGVSVSGTLFGMDSTSDGYGLPKGSIAISGTVAPVTEFAGKNTTEGDYTVSLHRYLAVNDSVNVDTWSFHRYNLSVGEEYYLEVLSNNTARIGVSAYFRGNSAVRSKLSEMGILIGSATTPTATAVSGVTDPYTLYYTSDAAEMKLANLTPSVKAALKFTTNSNYYYSNPWTVDFVTLLKTYYQSADANAKAILESFATVAGIQLT